MQLNDDPWLLIFFWVFRTFFLFKVTIFKNIWKKMTASADVMVNSGERCMKFLYDYTCY